MSVWAYRTGDGRRYRGKFSFQGKFYEKKGFLSKENALTWEVELRKSLKSPPSLDQTIQTPSISFATLASKYLEHCRARMQRNTWRYKARYYREFLAWNKGDIAADQVKSGLLNDYLIHIQTLYGSKRANRDLKDIKAFYAWASRQEDAGIHVNPCKFIEPFPETPYIKYVPPIEDLDAVLMAAAPHEMDLIRTLYHTFGRIGEILRLKWEDVNFEARVVVLWTRKRRRGELRRQPKPMTDTLFKLLMALWKDRNKEEPWVFLNPNTGKPYSQRPRWMKRLCERAGVKPFDFHSIRHLVAHYLDDTNKATLRQIRDLLGHQRISTTDLYLQSMSPDLMEAASLLERRDEGQDDSQSLES